MAFLINGEELEALSGLPHIQQLAYLKGIRPYMDLKTGLVGIKRRISYQSISEQLYVEPYQGIKSQSFSRDQVRRAVSGLVRAGVVVVQSEGMQLILKCQFALKDNFGQKKAAINPPQNAAIESRDKSDVNTGLTESSGLKADKVNLQKAATPHNSNNNYIFLLKQHFEQFWSLYPVKSAEQKAWEMFQALNPSEALMTEIINALKSQLNHVQRQQALGLWVPNWKNPANWLAQRCWNDVIPTNQLSQENKNAKNHRPYRHQETTDPLWNTCKPGSNEDGEPTSNIIPFSKR